MKLMIINPVRATRAPWWRGLDGALCRAGHEVVIFDRSVPAWSTPAPAVPGLSQIFGYDRWEEIEHRVPRCASEADVVILSPSFVETPRAAEIIAAARGLRVLYSDTHAPPPPEAIGGVGLAEFDLVLSPAAGAVVDELHAAGARRVSTLRPFVDPNDYQPMAVPPEKRVDLAVWLEEEVRDDVLESLVETPARRLPGRRFVVAGDWRASGDIVTGKWLQVNSADPAAIAAFLSSARLVLTLQGEESRAAFRPPAVLFRAAACGVPLISGEWSGLGRFLRPGSEVLVAHAPADIVTAIERDDASLRVMAHRARERVLEEHTASHRAIELERLLMGIAGRESRLRIKP